MQTPVRSKKMAG